MLTHWVVDLMLVNGLGLFGAEYGFVGSELGHGALKLTGTLEVLVVSFRQFRAHTEVIESLSI